MPLPAIALPRTVRSPPLVTLTALPLTVLPVAVCALRLSRSRRYVLDKVLLLVWLDSVR